MEHVKLVLAHNNVDVNLANKQSGNTPLIAVLSNPEIFEILISDPRVDVNRKDLVSTLVSGTTRRSILSVCKFRESSSAIAKTVFSFDAIFSIALHVLAVCRSLRYPTSLILNIDWKSSITKGFVAKEN